MGLRTRSGFASPGRSRQTHAVPAPDILILATIGGLITVASAMIGGLRLHILLTRYAPSVAAALPRDICIAAGLTAGCAVVAGWFVSS
jgi:hypothetical protein